MRHGAAAASAFAYHSNVRTNKRSSELPVTDDLCSVPCFKAELVARLRAALPAEDCLEEARIVFAALADRSRLKLLHALRGGEELCVCDVAHVLGVSVSAASHHLRKLRDLRILEYRNDGRMTYYSLRDRLAAALVDKALRRVKS